MHSLKKYVFLLIPIFLETISAQTQHLSILSIDDCIRLALKNNPRSESARGTLCSAKGNYISTRSSVLPQFNLQAQATGSNGSGSNPPVFLTATPSYSTTIQAQQLIYDFGKTSSKVSSSRELYDAAQYDSATIIQDLILSTIIAYINLIESRFVVQINREALKQTEDHLKNAQILYDAGRDVKYNVVKAEVDKANADLNLVQGRNTEYINVLQLQNLIGETIDSTIVLTDTLFIKDNLPTVNSAISAALQNRSDLKSLKMRVNAAEDIFNSAKRGYLPSLSLIGGYGYRVTDLPVQNLSPSWNIGAALGVPIYTGGSQRGAIEQAAGNQKNAEASLNMALQAVMLDIQQQLSSCAVAGQRIDISTKAVDQAQLALTLAQERFNIGSGSAIEVADAEISLENSKIAGIQARCDYRISRVKLARAIGTLTAQNNLMEKQ